MKRKSVIILIILFGFLNMKGQVPGYIGKRLAVFAEFGLSPAFNNSYNILDYYDRSSVSNFGINFRPGIGLDFTVSKVVTLGVTFKHLNTHIPMNYYSISLPENPELLEYASYFGDVDISANFGSFYFKLYPFQRKGSIAPIGKYHKFEFVYGFASAKTGGFVETNHNEYINVESQQYSGFVNSNSLVLTNFEDLNYQYAGPLAFLIYAFGAETIIFDKVTADYNLQLGLPLTGYLSYINEDDVYITYTDIDERVQNTFYFGVNMSFGYFIK